MHLKIIPLEEKIEELTQIIEANRTHRKEPLVLEENENSDLVPIMKPCTEEFFQKVFDPLGPFWSTYSETGFGIKPVGEKYALFIRGKMYFIRNIENKFINRLGPEKSFRIKEGCLHEEIKLNGTNFTLVLSYFFDMIKQFVRMAELGFSINEAVREFEKFRQMAIDHNERHTAETNIEDLIKTAEDSLELATKAMGFSNLALLGYGLKIRLRKSEAIENCEAEQLRKMTERKDFDSIKNIFGFYSLSPYDISKPRFRESTEELEKYGAPESPRNIFLKWRENAKFLTGRFLDAERIAYQEIGRLANLGDLVFYLKTSELQELDLNDAKKIENLADIAQGRKETFKKFENIKLPSKIIIHGGKVYEPSQKTAEKNIKALSVSSAKTVTGQAVNINSFEDYEKCSPGSIIVSKTLSPDLTILFRKAAGLVSDNGGALSHAALVAREMNIPCLIQANLGESIKDGQWMQLDGKTGVIKLLNEAPEIIKEEIKSPKQNQTNKKFNAAEKYGSEKPAPKDILWFGEDGFDASFAGTKAVNLSMMSEFYPIPAGFTITTKIFKEIIDESEEIKNLIVEIKNINPGNFTAIDKLVEKIRKIIVSYVFPPEIKQNIAENFQKLMPETVAVRSSSSLEDLPEASFAGQFDTYLDIKNYEETETAIKKCWASFYNTRAIIYRLENNMNDVDGGMAVVIQKMVEPVYSGVMFTREPDGDNKIMIEAVPGRGENLVSGKTIPNSYLIMKNDFSIETIKTNFDFDVEKIKDIAKIGCDIEKTFDAPQDIEWCIDSNGKIWILQSRPITGL